MIRFDEQENKLCREREPNKKILQKRNDQRCRETKHNMCNIHVFLVFFYTIPTCNENS